MLGFINAINRRSVFKWDVLGKEILQIAVPAALAVAADPVASLIDTAFIGHIGMYFLDFACTKLLRHSLFFRIKFCF